MASVEKTGLHETPRTPPRSVTSSSLSESDFASHSEGAPGIYTPESSHFGDDLDDLPPPSYDESQAQHVESPGPGHQARGQNVVQVYRTELPPPPPISLPEKRSVPDISSSSGPADLLSKALTFTHIPAPPNARYAHNLSRPIAIPSLPGRSNPLQFARFYAKVLQLCHVSPEEFMQFVDGVNALCKASSTSARSLRALAYNLNFQPNEAVTSATLLAAYISQANYYFFTPRGIQIRLLAMDDLAEKSRITPEARGAIFHDVLRAYRVGQEIPAAANGAATSAANLLEPYIEPLSFSVPEPGAEVDELSALAGRLAAISVETPTREVPAGPAAGPSTTRGYPPPPLTHTTSAPATTNPSQNTASGWGGIGGWIGGIGGLGQALGVLGEKQGKAIGAWGEQQGKSWGAWGEQLGRTISEAASGASSPAAGGAAPASSTVASRDGGHGGPEHHNTWSPSGPQSTTSTSHLHGAPSHSPSLPHGYQPPPPPPGGPSGYSANQGGEHNQFVPHPAFGPNQYPDEKRSANHYYTDEKRNDGHGFPAAQLRHHDSYSTTAASSTYSRESGRHSAKGKGRQHNEGDSDSDSFDSDDSYDSDDTASDVSTLLGEPQDDREFTAAHPDFIMQRKISEIEQAAHLARTNSNRSMEDIESERSFALEAAARDYESGMLQRRETEERERANREAKRERARMREEGRRERRRSKREGRRERRDRRGGRGCRRDRKGHEEQHHDQYSERSYGSDARGSGSGSSGAGGGLTGGILGQVTGRGGLLSSVVGGGLVGRGGLLGQITGGGGLLGGSGRGGRHSHRHRASRRREERRQDREDRRHHHEQTQAPNVDPRVRERHQHWDDRRGEMQRQRNEMERGVIGATGSIGGSREMPPMYDGRDELVWLVVEAFRG